MSALLSYYPWHEDLAQKLFAQKDHLSHAYLLYGLEGTGKRDFAHRFASALFCEASAAHFTACGQCIACEWMKQGQHPDYMKIRPEAVALEENDPSISGEDEKDSKKTPSKDIVVDQIRHIETWLRTGSTRGKFKIVVIYPIERMNPIASNALLKILEEPPQQTLFLLITHQLPRIMPTIRSRCRLQPMPVPAENLALQWLAQFPIENAAAHLTYCGGAPLQAYALGTMKDTPVPYIWIEQALQSWASQSHYERDGLYAIAEKQGVGLLIQQLQKIYSDLAYAQHQLPAYFFPQWNTLLEKTANRLVLSSFNDFGKWLNAQVRIANHPLSSRLYVDTLFTAFENIFNE